MPPQPLEEISPLDRIRAAEADIARRVAAAQEQGAAALRAAKESAAAAREAAAAEGLREGEKLVRDSLAAAESETHGIVLQARHRAAEISRRGLHRMDEAVHFVVLAVLGEPDPDAPGGPAGSLPEGRKP